MGLTEQMFSFKVDFIGGYITSSSLIRIVAGLSDVGAGDYLNFNTA